MVLKVQTLIVITSLLKKYQERFLKARFPNLYKDKTYIGYYNFCQQCENYFTVVEAKRSNYILFIMSFL